VPKKKTARKTKPSGLRSFPVPDEMKQWCTLLTQELATWGEVGIKKMFGMTSFYRRGAIFAALPSTKAFFSPYSIIFKLQQPTSIQSRSLVSDPQVNLSFGIGQKWYGFELSSPADINRALSWLDEAFRHAQPARKPRRKRST
jgi:hypothetical protein